MTHKSQYLKSSTLCRSYHPGKEKSSSHNKESDKNARLPLDIEKYQVHQVPKSLAQVMHPVMVGEKSGSVGLRVTQ